MLRAIRENLEFIADRKVLQNGTDARRYQYALLATQQGRSNPVSNNFNISHLKFRITMMNRSKSSDMQVMKYLLAVPAVTGLLLLTGLTQAKEKQEPLAVVASHALPEANLKDFIQAAVQEYNEAADTGLLAPPAPPAAPTAPTPPVPPTPPIHLLSGIDKNNMTVFINGIQTDTDPNTIDPKDIKEMMVYTSGTDKHNTSTKIHITTHGHQVSKDKMDRPVIFLDGKRYEDDLSAINPKSIKSMDVIKDEQRIRDYDATVRTDQGLILITTYEGDQQASNKADDQPFSIYPNPAAAHWTIKTDQQGANDSYELFDQDGNKKASGQLKQSTQINGTAFPEGVYFLKLRIDGKLYEARLAKGR